MGVNTVGFLAGLDIGYGNLKGMCDGSIAWLKCLGKTINRNFEILNKTIGYLSFTV